MSQGQALDALSRGASKPVTSTSQAPCSDCQASREKIVPEPSTGPEYHGVSS